MPITLNGSGTITGISAGGLPDAIITQPELAANVAGTGPAFSAYKSTNQTLTTGVSTKLTFDTEDFDTNNNFASSTFTPTVAGYYMIAGCSAWGASATGQATIYLYKNGSVFKNGNSDTLDININSTNISSLVYANGTTDYFEIYGIQNSGGNLISVGGSQYTFFQAALVRSA